MAKRRKPRSASPLPIPVVLLVALLRSRALGVLVAWALGM